MCDLTADLYHLKKKKLQVWMIIQNYEEKIININLKIIYLNLIINKNIN